MKRMLGCFALLLGLMVSTHAQTTLVSAEVLKTTSTTSRTLTPFAFTPILTENVVRDTLSGWSAAKNAYTVKVAGSYEMIVTFRLVDDSPGNIQYGVGAGTALADSPDFLWCQTVAPAVNRTERNSCTKSIKGVFNVGDVIQPFMYLDAPGSYQSLTASFSLTLEAPTAAPVDSAFVPAGYHKTFGDEFPDLHTISDSLTQVAGAQWYTHVEQCCLDESTGTVAAMNGIGDGVDSPYSLIPGGGLDINLHKNSTGWHSGVLTSVDQNGAGFSQTYGYFEMSANYPAGPGTWPAFWMLSLGNLHQNQGGYVGEIDIDESYMQFPTYINSVVHDWTGGTTTFHGNVSVADLTQGYHVFGFLWTATTMSFYSDGKFLYSTPTPAGFHQPYYLLVDLGFGGGWPTNNTPSSNNMNIKYIRAYAAD